MFKDLFSIKSKPALLSLLEPSFTPDKNIHVAKSNILAGEKPNRINKKSKLYLYSIIKLHNMSHMNNPHEVMQIHDLQFYDLLFLLIIEIALGNKHIHDTYKTDALFIQYQQDLQQRSVFKDMFGFVDSKDSKTQKKSHGLTKSCKSVIDIVSNEMVVIDSLFIRNQLLQ